MAYLLNIVYSLSIALFISANVSFVNVSFANESLYAFTRSRLARQTLFIRFENSYIDPL
jgi:hypothetical protein